MTKRIRYFHNQDEADNKPSEESGVKKPPLKAKKKIKKEIVHKIKPKTKPWRYKTEEATTTKKTILNPNPKFPGRVPIPEEKLEKYSRGEGFDKTGVRTGVHKKKLQKKEENVKFANELAARAEILLIEDSGFLEADPGETTTQFTQKAIAENVDITAATKHFDLRLTEFGPYRAKYTRNGRHLLLGGKMGHVAAFDWLTKKLHCEINVMESVHDICWLHIETMFAVAQKNWVYIYDNQGIELHCLRKLHKVSRMEFLPYHFLLATASEEGYLSWLDVSIGQIVNQYNTRLGRLTMLTQNPYNAVLCLGHSKGIVTMWAPNTKEPLVRMLCHKAPLSALHVDPKGTYIATAATDKSVKIWDARNLGDSLQTYRLRSTAGSVNFSHRNMLALGMGNIVEVYRDCCRTTAKRAYIHHRLDGTVGNLEFCPFEDVLGAASSRGFTSLLVPGAGEPNYDAREANPFQTKSQRKEAEVKALLEKIPANLISLDPTKIAQVDLPTLQDKTEAKKKLLYVKPPKIDYGSKKKSKGKGGTVKATKTKKILQEQAKKEFIKARNIKNRERKKPNVQRKQGKTPKNVLDRFLPKQM